VAVPTTSPVHPEVDFLSRERISREMSFYGQLSAAVEPLAACIGAAIIFFAHSVLAFALAFAAGAMILVVIEEVMPESLQHGFERYALWGFLAGFLAMMALDVGLG